VKNNLTVGTVEKPIFLPILPQKHPPKPESLGRGQSHFERSIARL
jgi:hypothetical protein